MEENKKTKSGVETLKDAAVEIIENFNIAGIPGNTIKNFNVGGIPGLTIDKFAKNLTETGCGSVSKDGKIGGE